MCNHIIIILYREKEIRGEIIIGNYENKNYYFERQSKQEIKMKTRKSVSNYIKTEKGVYISLTSSYSSSDFVNF